MKKISEAEAIASLKQRLNEVTVEEKPTEQQIDQFAEFFVSSIQSVIDQFKILPKRLRDAIVNWYNSIRSKKVNENAFLDLVIKGIKKLFNAIIQRIASALDLMIWGTILSMIFAKLSTMGLPLFASKLFVDQGVYTIFETLWHLLGAFLDFTSGGLLIPAIPFIGGVILAIAFVALLGRSKMVQNLAQKIKDILFE